MFYIWIVEETCNIICMTCFTYSRYNWDYIVLITPKGLLKHLQPMLAGHSVYGSRGLLTTPPSLPPLRIYVVKFDFQVFVNKITAEAFKGVTTEDWPCAIQSLFMCPTQACWLFQAQPLYQVGWVGGEGHAALDLACDLHAPLLCLGCQMPPAFWRGVFGALHTFCLRGT